MSYTRHTGCVPKSQPAQGHGGCHKVPPVVVEKGQMAKFKLALTVTVPEPLLYEKSVEEWRDWLFGRYEIERDAISSFESVAEHILYLWLAGYDEFQNVGIVPEVETLESLG